MRRDTAGILATYEFDPERRELYVEGPKDRRFLRWLVADGLHRNVSIRDVDSVDLKVEDGGNRQRLMAFAALTIAESRIRCFADADWDRLRGISAPVGVWFTDNRDLEWYVLRQDCVGKILALALERPDIDANLLLQSVLGAARLLAALRLVSARDALRLPFQSTNLSKFVDVNDWKPSLRQEPLLRALLAAAGLVPAAYGSIASQWAQRVSELADVSNQDLVHGKDAFMILGEVFLSLARVARTDAPRILWASFERSLLEDYDVLREVVAYLESGEVS